MAYQQRVLMKIALLAFSSMVLLAQPQENPKTAQTSKCIATIWAKVPNGIKTLLAQTVMVPNNVPPFEILVKSVSGKTQSLDSAGLGSGAIGRVLKAGGAQQAQSLDTKALFSGKALEVYSRMQARVIGEGLVTPSGEPLKFNSLMPTVLLTNQGVVTRQDAGNIIMTDSKSTLWSLRFKVVGPKPAEKWLNDPVFSDDCLKFQSLILAGDWEKAQNPELLASVKKSSPNEPLLLALEILESIDQPKGKEAQLQVAAATLSSLVPRNANVISLCAAAFLVSGSAEQAGHLMSWMSEMKLVTP
jgi:hypothetical protein